MRNNRSGEADGEDLAYRRTLACLSLNSLDLAPSPVATEYGWTTMSDALEAYLADLRETLPAGAVSLDDADREHHAVDCWPVALKRRQQQGVGSTAPAAVVRPTMHDDVVNVVRLAGQHRVAVTPWGAGSSVVGQAIPEPDGISLDMGALDTVLEIDEENLLVRVQAGALGSDVEVLLNGRGYTLNFSPQSLYRSTVGGWVATRATGQFSSRWGGIEDALVALTAVLPTGEILATRPVPRAATGPDIKQLLVGAEGTLGVVTEVVLRMYPVAPSQLLETVLFADVASGLDGMQGIVQAGLRPFLLRLYDQEEARHALRDSRFEGAALMVGTEGIESVAVAELAAAHDICAGAGGAPAGPAGAEGWMSRRYDFSAIQEVLDRPGGIAETIEVSHTWTGIRETHRRLKEVLRPLAAEVLGHFSHAYPNGTSLYVIVLGDAASAADAEQRLLEVWKATMATCLQTGAAIAHHHGVGLARLPWLRQDVGSAIEVLDRIKQALDPAGIFCPGRLALSQPDRAR